MTPHGWNAAREVPKSMEGTDCIGESCRFVGDFEICTKFTQLSGHVDQSYSLVQSLRRGLTDPTSKVLNGCQGAGY